MVVILVVEGDVEEEDACYTRPCGHGAGECPHWPANPQPHGQLQVRHKGSQYLRQEELPGFINRVDIFPVGVQLMEAPGPPKPGIPEPIQDDGVGVTLHIAVLVVAAVLGGPPQRGPLARRAGHEEEH